MAPTFRALIAQPLELAAIRCGGSIRTVVVAGAVAGSFVAAAWLGLLLRDALERAGRAAGSAADRVPPGEGLTCGSRPGRSRGATCNSTRLPSRAVWAAPPGTALRRRLIACTGTASIIR